MTFRNEFTQGLDGLITLRDSWDDLFASTPNRAFYNDWRWHAAIARHLIEKDLYYLCVLDGNRPVAIFPIHHSKRKMRGLTVGYLSQPSHPHIVVSDVLVHSDYVVAALWTYVCKALRTQRELPWDYARFSRFTARSNLSALCRAAGHQARVINQCYYAKLADPAAGTPDQVSMKQLRNARRLEVKACASYGSAEMELVARKEGLADAFGQFASIEASGWKGHEGRGSAIKLNAQLVEFYKDVLSSFGETEEASIGLLRFGDRFVAGHLRLHSNGTLYLLKIGYDEAYESVGPGMVLMKAMLERSAGRFFEVNLLTAPSWADRWHFNSEAVLAADVYRSPAYGVAVRSLRALAKILSRKQAA